MSQVPTGDKHPPAYPVTVRFWAGARRAAGCTEERHHANTVAELRATLASRPELTAIIDVAAILVDSANASDSATLHAGAIVDVLPPFAGG